MMQKLFLLTTFSSRLSMHGSLQWPVALPSSSASLDGTSFAEARAAVSETAVDDGVWPENYTFLYSFVNLHLDSPIFEFC